MEDFKNSIEEKGISEILHFTTNKGVLGALKTWALLPNSQLSSEDTLSFIFQQNSPERKERDKKWLEYVNLSITKLNFEFFNYSQYVHRASDLYWAIFSFDPEILTHDGVIFTTTNNIYPSCSRGAGLSGFEAVFNESILGKFQKKVIRTANHLPSWTTCQQSEVLYYGQLSLDYLSKIYVCDFESKYSIAAQMRALGIEKTIQIEVCPTMFEGI